MSDIDDPRFPSEPRLGDLLRQARESRGLELSDVAGITNVKREYLEALEEGRYADLPEDVYTRNFLRLFAQAVGFDVVRAQEIYRSELRETRGLDTAEQRLERDREMAADVPPAADGSRWWETPRSQRSWGPLVSTVLMVAAVVALALWGFNSTFFNASRGAPVETAQEAPVAGESEVEPEEENSAPIPRTVRLSVDSVPAGAEVLVDEFPLPGATPIDAAPVTARPSRTIRVVLEGYEPYEDEFDLTRDRNLSFFLDPIVAEPEQVAADDGAAGESVAGDEAAEADGAVVLTITEATWLEVYRGTSRNQGERLTFMTAQPGQSFSYELPIYVHVGNAGGVELTVDGQSRGALGSSGEVRGLAVTD